MKNSIDLILFFQSVSLFKNLPMDVIKKLVQLAKVKKVSQKTTICNANKKITHLHFLYKGFAKSYVEIENGRQNNYDLFSEFDVLEITEILIQSNYLYDIDSLSRAILIILPIRILNDLIEDTLFLKNLIVCKNKKAANQNHLLNTLFAKDHVKRSVMYIIYILSKKTGYRDDKDMIIKNLFSQEELAGFIGITRKSFVENLKLITDEKIVKRIGNTKEKRDFFIKNYDGFVKKYVFDKIVF